MSFPGDKALMGTTQYRFVIPFDDTDGDVGTVCPINLAVVEDSLVDSIWIKEAVNKLEDGSAKTIAKLYYLYGLSMNEIADVLGISSKSVRREFNGCVIVKHGIRVTHKGIKKTLKALSEKS